MKLTIKSQLKVWTIAAPEINELGRGNQTRHRSVRIQRYGHKIPQHPDVHLLSIAGVYIFGGGGGSFFMSSIQQGLQIFCNLNSTPSVPVTFQGGLLLYFANQQTIYEQNIDIDCVTQYSDFEVDNSSIFVFQIPQYHVRISGLDIYSNLYIKFSSTTSGFRGGNHLLYTLKMHF